ncbi:MAG: hypothetical protein IIU14_04985 [Ruminococcus sp.]|nr:hypothetical protein [Ruminococcus sp.]
MNRKKLRFAYLALAIIFILSIFTVKVFADEEDEGDVTPTTPVETQAPPVETNPPETKAPDTPKPTSPPATKSSSTSSKSTYSSESEYTSKSKSTYSSSRSRYSSSSSTYQSKSYYSSSAANNNNNNYSSSNNAYISRSQSVASTRAATAAVYNAKSKVDNQDTLKNKDWKSITAQLKNATNKGDSDSGDDFGWIQNNTSSSDNGVWILYVGIALEVVAGVIIITLIVLAIRRRKKMDSRAGRRSDNDRRTPPRGGSNNRISDRQAAPQRPDRAVRAQSLESRRQVNRRSKFDTDEVYIPKKTQKRSSGRRYKPRH